MIYLRFNNKTIRQKFIDIIENMKSSSIDIEPIMDLINSQVSKEYIIPDNELQTYEDLLAEVANRSNLKCYYISGISLICVRDLINGSGFSKCLNDYSGVLSLVKYENEADVYIRNKTKSKTDINNLSPRDAWRYEKGGID